jgi:hypothetical protein
MKLGFCGDSFEKYPNIKFDENPFSGSRVVPGGPTDGQTDRRDEAIRRFSQFCEKRLKTNTNSIPKAEILKLYNFLPKCNNDCTDPQTALLINWWN